MSRPNGSTLVLSVRCWGFSASPEPPAPRAPGRASALVLSRASGARDIPIAVCRSLADYFGVPINGDALRDQVDAVLRRQEQLSLVNLGQILDSLGLRVMLSRVPHDRLHRVATPAVVMQNGHIGVVDGVDADGVVRVLEAELGCLRVPSADLVTQDGGLVELLLFERKSDAKEQTFNWSWYWPFLRKHRRALVEVLLASAAINVLMLATPLGFRLLLDTARQSNIGSLVSIAAVMLGCLRSGAVPHPAQLHLHGNRQPHRSRGKSVILDQMVRLPQLFRQPSGWTGHVLFQPAGSFT